MRIILTASVGVLAGIAFAPFAHKTVAAAAGSPVRFQVASAIVEEQNTDGRDVPIHEAFLIDTDTGNVWHFRGNIVAKNGNRSELVPEQFVSIPVETPQATH